MGTAVAAPSHYHLAAEMQLSDDLESEEALNLLFKIFNEGDHGGLHVRSMSVGDKIRLEGRGVWFCKSRGWELLRAFSSYDEGTLEAIRRTMVG
jgi:hypothetical protein